MCLARFTTEILKSEILPFKSVNSDPSKFGGVMKFSYLCIVNRKW